MDFDTYKRLLENRPFKFSAEEVNYRKGESPYQCQNCAHFFTRKLDGFTVCEIFRPSGETEEAIDPAYTCDFQNDGDEYPYQD